MPCWARDETEYRPNVPDVIPGFPNENFTLYLPLADGGVDSSQTLVVSRFPYRSLLSGSDTISFDCSNEKAWTARPTPCSSLHLRRGLRLMAWWVDEEFAAQGRERGAAHGRKAKRWVGRGRLEELVRAVVIHQDRGEAKNGNQISRRYRTTCMREQRSDNRC